MIDIRKQFGDNPTQYELGFIDALESVQLVCNNDDVIQTALDAYANNEV